MRSIIYSKDRNIEVSIINKFCALSLGVLLCLAGCKDSEHKPLKEQTSRANQKNVDNKPEPGKNSSVDQKKLLDEAKFWGLTNLETLGMTLDSTTRDQAIDILKSRRYEFITQLGSDL